MHCFELMTLIMIISVAIIVNEFNVLKFCVLINGDDVDI